MCLGGVSLERNALSRLLETISAITPDVDRLTGPVLEKGELANASVPKLAFEGNSLKVGHSQFKLYDSICKLESGGSNGSVGNIFFEFFYKIIIWSFLTMPFNGHEEHEIVECVWYSLVVHEAWRDFIEREGSTEVYLLVNYVVRYTVRVKKGTGRKFFFQWMYNEELVNKLQKNVFKVVVHSTSCSCMNSFCVYRLFTAFLRHQHSVRVIRKRCSRTSLIFLLKP